MSKPSAGSSALNICDVNVDLYLSSSSLLSLDGLYCNNCYSQQEVQVASLRGLWPKLTPKSNQQPSPTVATKKNWPKHLLTVLSWHGWCQTCQTLDPSSDSWLAGLNTSTSRKWPASRQQGDSAYKPTCLKFNKNDRECPFGARCRNIHLLTMTKQLWHDCSALAMNMNWPGTIGEATRIFKLVGIWVRANC